MKLLAVASLIFSLCQVHNKGHKRVPQTTTATTTTTTTATTTTKTTTTTATAITTTTTMGRPPKCTKSSCEKIISVGLDPFRDFPDDIPSVFDIEPEVVYAYKKWRASNKSHSNKWFPTKNCTSEPIGTGMLGGRSDYQRVGLSKSNEIVHVFRVQMSNDCVFSKKDCDDMGWWMFEGMCYYITNNLITINQFGEVIGDALLGNWVYDWDAYADLSCLSC